MQTALRGSGTAAVNPTATMYRILFAISLVHLFNDSMQAVIPAMFPILKKTLLLTYFQIGLIAFAQNATASLIQPVIGLYTDRKPSPYMLPLGMASTFLGMLGIALAPNFNMVLLSVVLVGFGSAIFHPEGSRVAHMAAGNKKGLAQSIYQVGGNAGQSLAPVMTALVFGALGQIGAIWFTFVAFTGIIVQLYIAGWYREYTRAYPRTVRSDQTKIGSPARRKKIISAVAVLLLFVFARSWYHAGITSFYPFYLIEKFHLSNERAQIYVFLFLFAGVVGTFLGGPLADRFGKRSVILFSMLGTAPLALMLPYANETIALFLCLIIGFIILSSFSVLVVYAQELIPGKIGLVSGLIVGLAFGMGAIGSASLGGLADTFGIDSIIKFCSILPLFGLIAFFLPTDRQLKELADDQPQ